MAAVLLVLASGLERPRQYSHELGATPETIQRTRFDHPFNGGAAHDLVIDTLAEIKEVLERPPILPRLHDFLGRAPAKAFDGRQSKHDLSLRHRELDVAEVDIRREHRDAEAARVFDVLHEHVPLITVFDLAGK